jgi:drug/metabolite transporter superfamily protein YnfA
LPRKLPRKLSRIVAALGLYFIIGAIAWTTFIYNGIPVPDSFATILATIAGGLVGVLAPTGGPTRPSPPSQEQRPSAEQ